MPTAAECLPLEGWLLLSVNGGLPQSYICSLNMCSLYMLLGIRTLIKYSNMLMKYECKKKTILVKMK